MSRLPDFIIKAADLARQMRELCDSGPGIIGVDGLGHAQVHLREDLWQKVMGPREGVHTVEVKGDKIFYCYSEDGIDYVAVGHKEADDEQS